MRLRPPVLLCILALLQADAPCAELVELDPDPGPSRPVRVEETDLPDEPPGPLPSEAALTQAKAIFESSKQPDSIPLLTDILSGLEAEGSACAAQTRCASMMETARALRAEALFNLGRVEDSAADLESLLTRRPSFELDSTLVSPKLVALFERVRATRLASIDLKATPADASFEIDGSSGAAEAALWARPGIHEVAVRRPGYAPWSEAVNLKPGEARHLDVRLERISAVVRILTEPRGVDVLRDGSAPAISRSELANGEDTLSDAEQLQIEGLTPGPQVLEFRKPGFRTRRLSVTVHSIDDYELAPIRLERARASVHLSGLTTDTKIWIDGESLGGNRLSPRTDLDLSPGKHNLKAFAPGQGAFESSFSLEDAQSLDLEVQLRPALAFLGVVGGNERPSAELWARLRLHVQNQSTWSLQDRSNVAAPGLVRRGLDVALFRYPEFTGGPSESALQALFDDLDPNRESALFLLGVDSGALGSDQFEVWIWPRDVSASLPTRIHLASLDEPSLAPIATALERPTKRRSSYHGLHLMESPLSPSPGALAVDPASPAALAGIKPGQLLDAPQETLSCLLDDPLSAYLACEPGSLLRVSVTGSGQAFQAELTPRASLAGISLSERNTADAVLAGWTLFKLSGPLPPERETPLRFDRAILLLRRAAWRQAATDLSALQIPPDFDHEARLRNYLLALAMLRIDGSRYHNDVQERLTATSGDSEVGRRATIRIRRPESSTHEPRMLRSFP